MGRAYILASAIFLVAATSASAGLLQWSSEKEADPFSGGESISADFMSSLRSGVFVLCDSAKPGIIVRAIPGFAYDARLAEFKPKMKFAFDGKLLFVQDGETGSVGDNLAISQTHLEGVAAKMFVEAFVAAKKQIAIDDGIADKPHLLTARGSTAAGQAIVGCVSKQSVAQ